MQGGQEIPLVCEQRPVVGLAEVLSSASTTPHTRTVHTLHPLVNYTNLEVRFLLEDLGAVL